MVKIVIGNIMSRIIGFLPDEVQHDLDEKLSYTVAGVEHSKAVKEGKWDGVSRLYKKSYGQSFLTGLLSIVIEVLEKHKIEFQKVNDRVKPIKNMPDLKFSPLPDYEERDYQQFTIDRCIKRTRGIIKMATGSGKTMVTAELISRIQTYPFMFYVLSNDLLEQAHGVLSSVLNEPIGRIGGGDFDVKRINVCTIQTAVMAVNLENKNFKISDYKFDEEDEWDDKAIEGIEKKKYLKKLIYDTKGIIFDEVHHVSCKTAREVIEASPFAFWKYGCSATPYREDGAEILIQALFGKKIVDISASYLIKRGDLVRPYIFIEPILQNCKLQSYKSIYSECVVNNNTFNTHVADSVNHLVKSGLSVLVLVQQYKQGDYLKKLIPNSEFITGKLSPTKRLQYIEDLRCGKITLIATSLADEGLDARGLDAVVMAGGGKSATKVNQRLGRALRKDNKYGKQKERAIAIVYEHNVKYLEKHASKVRSIFKKEPEFKIINSKGPLYILNEIDELLGVSQQKKYF